MARQPSLPRGIHVSNSVAIRLPQTRVIRDMRAVLLGVIVRGRPASMSLSAQNPSSNTIFAITCSALRATCLRSAGSAILSMRDPKKRMLRQTKRLFVGRLVSKSKGSKTKRFAFDKPQLGRRRPVREKPPSPSHDEGLD